MALQILAFIVVGITCSLVANLPALLEARRNRIPPFARWRVLGLLVAQAVIFAGFSVLTGYLQRERRIDTLTHAALFGGLFGLFAIVTAPRASRTAGRNLLLGVSLVACSAAAFLIAPSLWAK
jgi:hypothetical protein